jgi:hypothetical protein
MIRPQLKLLEKDIVVVTKDFRHEYVTVPKGFKSDLASIPRPFWILIGHPFHWRFRAASLVHDYLLEVKDPNADEVFKKILEEYKVEKWRVYIMYIGVKLKTKIRNDYDTN